MNKSDDTPRKRDYEKALRVKDILKMGIRTSETVSVVFGYTKLIGEDGIRIPLYQCCERRIYGFLEDRLGNGAANKILAECDGIITAYESQMRGDRQLRKITDLEAYHGDVLSGREGFADNDDEGNPRPYRDLEDLTLTSNGRHRILRPHA